MAVIMIFFSNVQTQGKNTLTAKDKIKQLDLLGMFFFIPSIICLVLALQWGGSKYDWVNGRIIALLAVFVLLFGAFICVQYFNGELGTLPPRIIMPCSIVSGAWFSFCTSAAIYVLAYYVSFPFYYDSCVQEAYDFDV